VKNFPRISIVIPSFNKVRYIETTLKSIFSQKYANLEVVIQDGASTDGTLKVIKKYLRLYPKLIKFESKRDKGQLDAILKGIKKSTGDIISFINADDSYSGQVFTKVAKCYLDHPSALWFAGRGIVVNSNNIEIAKPVTLYKNLLLVLNSYVLLLSTNYLMQPAVFFTKKAYKEFGPFTGRPSYILEYDFWLHLGRQSMPIIINDMLVKFRIEASTKTKRMFGHILKDDERTVRKYTRNMFILFFHRLNNIGRIALSRFV
jgi:hypothetical protein